MGVYLDGLGLAREMVRLTEDIDFAARSLWPVIKATKDVNEYLLIKIIFDTYDKLIELNEIYQRKQHLTELDFANENSALALDIKDAAERLWPTVKKTSKAIPYQDLLNILYAANRMIILCAGFAQKKVEEAIQREIDQVASDALKEG